MADLTEALSSLTSLAGPINVDSTTMGQHMIEASSSIEGKRAARVLLETADRSREEIGNQAVATVPKDRIPAKIAIWIAGLLLTVSNLAYGGSSMSRLVME